MAIDFTHPQISDNYSTGYTAGIVANQIAQAQWLDSVQTTITAGAVQYMKRYNRTSLLFEEYSGSAWATLATNYAVLNATNTFSANNAPIVINSTNSNVSKIVWQDNGTLRGLLGANATYQLVSFNASSVLGFSVDQTGNGQFAAACTATQFNGSGAGLTGTGASFTAGTASVANSLNTGNAYTVGGLVVSPAGTNSQLPVVSGSGSVWYKAMLMNSGAQYAYLMSSTAQTSQASANAASWSSVRPFIWDMNTGAVQIDNTGAGCTFGAGATFNNVRAVNATTYNQIVMQVSGSTKGYLGADATRSLAVVNGANSVFTFQVDQAGNGSFAVSVNAPTVTQTSDETKKHNWETPDSRATVRALSKMKTWGNFDFIESGIKSLGVGAQSIRKIPAFKNAIHGDKKTGLTMNYGGAAMVASIALSKELEALRARVAALEGA